MQRSQSNGFVESLHRTLFDEHFRIMGRKNFYESVEAMQIDLGTCLIGYITERLHHRRGMKDRTPADVFIRCLPKPGAPMEQQVKQSA